ncbi:MAG: DUF4339 domain-containing protein [Phycisphaerales bacterium]|nr:DUF4339 domain-containing protein [Phycisphaerales bacterium]
MSDAAPEGTKAERTAGAKNDGAGQPGAPRPSPVPRPASALCPYCGEVSRDMTRCSACGGPFDPLSRQATQNAMGPWFVRDPGRPFRPGCSFAELRRAVERGRIGPETIVRGPTTHQFWAPARRAPGLANLLGVCHACGGGATQKDYVCRHCGVAFPSPGDRQHMGLVDSRPLPGRDRAEAIVSDAGPSVRSGGDWAFNRVLAESSSIDAEGVTLHIGRRRRRSPLWPVAAMVACALVVGVGLGVGIGRLPSLLQDGVTPEPSSRQAMAPGEEERASPRGDGASGVAAESVGTGVRGSTESASIGGDVGETDTLPAERIEESMVAERAGDWSERLVSLLLEDSLGSVATARELVRRDRRDGREHAISTRAEGYVDRRFQVVRIRTLP